MALNKEDRISFSKIIVEADASKLSIDRTKAQLLIEKNKVYNLDQANKRLCDSVSTLITGYHLELSRYNGISRLNVAEIDFQNSANMVKGNYFYPNDPASPPPSTAPNVWTKDKPFSLTIAVGKQANETYPAAIAAEQSKLTNVLALITTIETNYTLIQRVTGQHCVETGTCSNISYTDEATCLLNGETWTPGPDLVQTYANLQTDHTNLVNLLNDLKSYVLTTQGGILTNDSDTSRQAQNNTAISDINTIIAAIDAWIAITTFNTSHGQTTCAGFNAYNPALLGSTRLNSANLTTLKTALQTRQTFTVTRVSQLTTNLGAINQNLSTGDSTGTGLYFKRWNFILLRLNFLGGSLISLSGFDRAIDAQDKQKAQIDLAKNTYSSLLTCSLLSAPTSGTKTIHVKNATGFSVGDNIFIISNSQEEIVVSIESINGKVIVLGKEIPAKYRPDDSARVYKDIS